MTDFRLVQDLHAYSGGSVPDLHRILYSPYRPAALYGTRVLIQLPIGYIKKRNLSSPHDLKNAVAAKKLRPVFFCFARA